MPRPVRAFEGVSNAAIVRFWEKVTKTESCWLWTGARAKSGYGTVFADKRFYSAHRFSFYIAKGDTPLHIDHLCRVRLCVCPDHLEAVTQQVNNEREGITGAAAVHKAKTECPKCGGPFSEIKGHKGKPARLCKPCNSQYKKDWLQEQIESGKYDSRTRRILK